MIPGQAECFLSHFRHKYREIPNFAEIYNYALTSLRDGGVEVALTVIDAFLLGLLEKQAPNIPVHDREPVFYVVRNGTDERMMSLWQVCAQYKYIAGLVEREKFEKVSFKVGNREVTVVRWKET